MTHFSSSLISIQTLIIPPSSVFLPRLRPRLNIRISSGSAICWWGSKREIWSGAKQLNNIMSSICLPITSNSSFGIKIATAPAVQTSGRQTPNLGRRDDHFALPTLWFIGPDYRTEIVSLPQTSFVYTRSLCSFGYLSTLLIHNLIKGPFQFAYAWWIRHDPLELLLEKIR